MKALIETCNKNRIAQVELDENIFDVALGLQWVSCPEDCTAEWSYSNGHFTRPDVTVMTKGVVQNSLSMQTRNVIDEKSTGQKNERLFSCSNALNTIAIPTAEAATDTAWRDAVCVKCYELLDIVRSSDMKTPSQEEQLVVLSILKWVSEFAKGKTAN